MVLRCPSRCTDFDGQVQNRSILHFLVRLLHVKVREDSRLLCAKTSNDRRNRRRSRSELAGKWSPHVMDFIYSGSDCAAYIPILVINMQHFDFSWRRLTERFGEWKYVKLDDDLSKLFNASLFFAATINIAFSTILSQCTSLCCRCFHQRRLAATWWESQGINDMGNFVQNLWAHFYDETAGWVSSR